MRFSSRIWILISASVIGLAALTTVSLVQLKNQMMEERRGQLSNLVELSHAALSSIHRREKAGELSREEAQKLAQQTLGSFHDNDRYFFARGFSDDIQKIHPNPSRVGTIDKDGKAKGDQYRASLAGKTVGFVFGEGTRPGVEGKVSKLYGVTRFEPWDWLVGYGLYVDDLNAMFWSNARLFMAICLVVIAVVGGLAYRMSRSILGQLGGEPQYATRLAIEIAGGDLSRQIEVRGRSDSLLGSMSTMREGLRSMVGGFRSASEQLASAATDLAHNMGQVSDGSKHTSEATCAASAAVQELTASVENVSLSAKETEENSCIATSLASRGEQLAIAAVSEIQKISSNMAEAEKVVGNLVARSRDIDSMSAAIRDIADQTNLLALNAAIEAARAGDQGRGFAVVADEVRKLAERTANATKDITETIRTIQRDTDTAASRMGEVRIQVETGVDLAEQAAAALREISNGAATTLANSRDVANAAHEQSVVSTSIARNVEHIARMVDASNAAVRAALEQVRRLDFLAQELHQTAADFKL